MARVAPLGRDFFSSAANVRRVASLPHGLSSRPAIVGLVTAQMLRRAGFGIRAIDDDLIQCRFQKFHIMHLRACGDYRQRDSIRVDEQAALGSFFSPDPWGSGRPPLAPKAP